MSGPPSGGSEAATVRVRMTLAYDGRGFHGFAAQSSEVRTVAGVVGTALERKLGQPVVLVAAGRTDAGVHAWGQVVSFDAPAGFDPQRFLLSLNRVLAPEVVVRAIEVADPAFDARRSARSRGYRYTVLNRPLPDPFLAATAWHVPELLDLGAMRLACDPLIGEHDFSSFCRRPRSVTGEVSMVRRVQDARWSDVGDDLLRFEIEASSFCQQMVRSIVGLMVAVGRGSRRAGEMAGVLRAGDRSLAPHLAPAHGLCLWEVKY
ncbi:MAG TPA: tRNA pseudouridine(38-40) synthase TruA [Acidimicrobiales bacterium]|nr:tRNA pseudouridine(38-40) synthase TruA [Acidimicrobiales bacterium]